MDPLCHATSEFETAEPNKASSATTPPLSPGGKGGEVTRPTYFGMFRQCAVGCKGSGCRSWLSRQMENDDRRASCAMTTILRRAASRHRRVHFCSQHRRAVGGAAAAHKPREIWSGALGAVVARESPTVDSSPGRESSCRPPANRASRIGLTNQCDKLGAV